MRIWLKYIMPQNQVHSVTRPPAEKRLEIYILTEREKESGGAHATLGMAHEIAQQRPANIHEFYNVPHALNTPEYWNDFFTKQGRPFPDIVLREGLIHLPETLGGKPFFNCSRFDFATWGNRTPQHIRHGDAAYERDVFQAQYPNLPRPLIAVCVGRSDASVIRNVLSDLSQRYREGTVFITSSPRTRREDFMQGVTEAGYDAYQENPSLKLIPFAYNSDSKTNPYLGLIHSADTIIVSDDSESMVAEAKATRATVYTYESAFGRLCEREAKYAGPLPVKKRRGVNSNRDIGLQVLERYDAFQKSSQVR